MRKSQGKLSKKGEKKLLENGYLLINGRFEKIESISRGCLSTIVYDPCKIFDKQVYS